MDVHFGFHARPDAIGSAELFGPYLAVFIAFEELGYVALPIRPLILARR